jgi:voltage-gated potassium channel
MSREPLLESAERRIGSSPLSLRSAARILMGVTLVVVLVAGLAMRLLDGEDFDNIGLALWWSLQTVTTVGYGDAVPTNAAGRAVGAVTMLGGIAFITVLTAVITSAFIERMRRQRSAEVVDDARGVAAPAGAIDAQLRDVAERLERIERALGGGGPA